MTILSVLLKYSISSIGMIALLYKIYRFLYLKKLARYYFKDKVILITGASSGLGKALSEELCCHSSQLILCSRDADGLEKVKIDLIKKRGGKEPDVLVMNMSEKSDIMKVKIEELLKKHKRIDILINNAGISFRGESLKATDEVYEKLMDVNFLGHVRLTNILVNQMIEENKRNDKIKVKKPDYSIVNIGSVQSFLGTPFRAPYGASKHAILAYSDSLRAELFAHRNIHVQTVHPGYINTNLSINALKSDGLVNNKQDENQKNGYSTEYVVAKIMYTILSKEKEVIVATLTHKIGIWIRFFWPNLYFWLMFNRARKNIS